MEMKAFQMQTADIVKQPCIKYDKVCTYCTIYLHVQSLGWYCICMNPKQLHSTCCNV